MALIHMIMTIQNQRLQNKGLKFSHTLCWLMYSYLIARPLRHIMTLFVNSFTPVHRTDTSLEWAEHALSVSPGCWCLHSMMEVSFPRHTTSLSWIRPTPPPKNDGPRDIAPADSRLVRCVAHSLCVLDPPTKPNTMPDHTHYSPAPHTLPSPTPAYLGMRVPAVCRQQRLQS